MRKFSRAIIAALLPWPLSRPVVLPSAARWRPHRERTVEPHAMMNPPSWAEALGYLAALLTTSSFMPQALLTLRTRNVSGISLAMYSAFTVGVGLWLAYGIVLGEWPIILANAVTLALATTILGIKLVEDRRARSTDQNR